MSTALFDENDNPADAADRYRGRNDADTTHLDKDAKTRLRSVVSRIESIEEEKRSLSERVKELLVVEKSHGLDPKIIRAVLKRRKLSKSALEEFDTMVELYEGVFA
jgi:uncharacterized protein (UPF0335 family)